MFKTIRQVRTVAALGGIDINRALLNGAKLLGQFALTLAAIWAFVVVLFCMGCSEAHAQDRATQSSCVAKALSNVPEQLCATKASSWMSCDACIKMHRSMCIRAATSCSLNPAETRELCGYYASLDTCANFGATWE